MDRTKQMTAIAAVEVIVAAAVLIHAFCGCSGTAPFQPENAHEPENADAGAIQCLAQEGVPEPPQDLAYWPDGAFDDSYLNSGQCQTYLDGGYTGR